MAPVLPAYMPAAAIPVDMRNPLRCMLYCLNDNLQHSHQKKKLQRIGRSAERWSDYSELIKIIRVQVPVGQYFQFFCLYVFDCFY